MRSPRIRTQAGAGFWRNSTAYGVRLGTTTFTYDAVGNCTQETFPNTAYTAYTYNDRNWLTSLENHKADQSLVSSYAYGHDNVGNRTSMTEANGDVTSYTYDNVYRLADETKRDSGDDVLYRYQYTYDGVGNRLTENNAGVINYTYDSNNKLTQLVGPGGTTTFGYDSNGNTTSMVQPGPVTTTYGYNYENRLVSVANPSYTAAYTYAGDGLRLRVQESNNANPDRWMQYDGVRPVLEGTLSGDTFTTVNKYVWEGDSYYDPLMYSLIGGSWRYHMYDGLGSTRQLMLHTDQSITDTYQYEAFGNLLSSTGTTPNPYRYVGSLGYYATGSSLMHLGARYYMPETGVFLQRDPLPVAPPYSYGYANPLGWADPQGLSFFSTIKNAARWVAGHRRATDCALEVTAAWAGPIKAPGSNRLSNRFRHCMVSCLIATECGVGIAKAGEMAKEVADYVLGSFGWGDFAYSAFQPSDFADNAAGRACPKGKDCTQHCQDSGLDPWTPESPPGPWYPYMPHLW